MSGTIKKISVVILAMLMVTVCFFGNSIVKKANPYVNESIFDLTPLVVQTNAKRENTEYIEINLDNPTTINGDTLAIELFLQNVSLNTLAVSINLKDSNGNEYISNTFGMQKINAIDYYDGGSIKTQVKMLAGSEVIDIPYEFFGTIYLPYAKMNRNANKKPADVKSVKIGFDAQSVGYDTLEKDIQKLLLFRVYDTYFNESTYEESNSSDIIDFNALPLNKVNKDGDNLILSKATTQDMDSCEYSYRNKNTDCKTIGDIKIINDFDIKTTVEDDTRYYAKMGQPSDFSKEASLYTNGGQMLKYSLGNQQDPAISNVYSSLHFNLSYKKQDWSNGKGITVWVKNPSSCEFNFGIEIFLYNKNTDKLEQYNLNNTNSLFKHVYAYDTVTNEEFSYNTQTYIRVPAKFTGWLRIPFYEYEAPDWTKLNPYNSEGVFDINRYDVQKISFSRLLKNNFGSTLYIDNLGIYYEDFTVGNLFDNTSKSMKDCINGGNV